MISCIGLISDIYRASFDNQQVPCPEYSNILILTLLDIAKVYIEKGSKIYIYIYIHILFG